MTRSLVSGTLGSLVVCSKFAYIPPYFLAQVFSPVQSGLPVQSSPSETKNTEWTNMGEISSSSTFASVSGDLEKNESQNEKRIMDRHSLPAYEQASPNESSLYTPPS